MKCLTHVCFRELLVTEDSLVLMGCQDLRYSKHLLRLELGLLRYKTLIVTIVNLLFALTCFDLQIV